MARNRVLTDEQTAAIMAEQKLNNWKTPQAAKENTVMPNLNSVTLYNSYKRMGLIQVKARKKIQDA